MSRPEGTPLRPADDDNARLLAEVHPPDWVNPRPRDRYHLVVLGAGTGGLVTAAIAAGLGARVALVERRFMGGDCLVTGCVPSKALLRAARAWAEARRASAEFGGPAARGPGDFGAAMARLRRLRADLAPVDGAARFRGLGVDVFLGAGCFTGPDSLEVGGASLRFARAVIATGARPTVPPIPGLEEAGCRTSESIFELEDRPDRLAVIGGGPIGCELAQAFARFGTAVTLVEGGPRLLPRDDPRASGLLATALARDGVRVVTGRAVRAVRRLPDGTRRLELDDGGTADADEILVAVGRTPNVEGLGLEPAGVSVGREGIAVDDRLRTTNRRIFAVGDVCTALRFTHVADAHARLVVPNALLGGLGGGRASRLVVPWVTYTDPEVAHVGPLPGTDGPALIELTVPLEEVDRAVLDGATEGFVTLRVDGRGRVAGGTIVGAGAGELLAPIVLAATRRMAVGALGGVVAAYPTTGAAIRRAADLWRRRRLTPSAHAWLKRAIALFTGIE